MRRGEVMAPLPKQIRAADHLPAVSGADEFSYADIYQFCNPKLLDKFKPVFAAELDPRESKKNWVIDRVYAEHEANTTSGLPGSGKSVLVTDQGCHIAAGMDWNDRKVKQGLVVYFAGERRKLTERRVIAFCKEHNIKDIPFVVLDGRIDLGGSANDAKDLLGLIRQLEDAAGIDCVMVVIDTLSRTFGKGSQNTTEDMGAYTQNVDLIRAELIAHFAIIHHTTWAGERGKGAIDLDGYVDTTLLVKNDDGIHSLIVTGGNDMDEEDSTIAQYTLESRVIFTDEEGNQTTAPVVKQLPIVKGRKAPSSDNSETKERDANVLAVIRDLADNNGHVAQAVAREGYAKKNPLSENASSGDRKSLNNRFDKAVLRLDRAGKIKKNGTSLTLLFEPSSSTSLTRD